MVPITITAAERIKESKKVLNADSVLLNYLIIIDYLRRLSDSYKDQIVQP